MSRGTILVVEDDVNLLAGIRDILEIEQFTVHTACDGVDGLNKLQQMPALPDLIVSDIMMPRMDGIEFLTQVRQVDAFVSIPFIYLTAKGERSDIQRGKQLGVDDYVVKPFNATELLVAVRSRLNRAKDINRVQEGRENELKKSILTILNHEFRTPLTFVVAYSDMLGDFATGEGGSPPDDSELLVFLEGVKNGADRLRRLIENFILLVELETGSAKRTYDWRRKTITDLEALIQDAIEKAGAINHAQAQRCKILAPAGLPAIMGDDEFLRAALTHLIDNALKFSDGHQPVEINVNYDAEWVQIGVRDYGRGIPPNEQAQVWHSFYQVNRPLYEDQGAGSGLAIVRHIAVLHGGDVGLMSEVGNGSEFTLRLPIVLNPSKNLQQS